MYNNFQQPSYVNQQPGQPVTPYNNQMMNQQLGNINRSFTPNTPLIEAPDFRNRNELLHNNVNENTITDNVTEYTIHIDSVNRDPSMYPNQFKFTTSFGGNMEPNINRSFKNVLYIKILNVILPKSTKAIDTTTMSTDTEDVLENDRYLILKIKELSDNHTLSTGTFIRDDTIRLLLNHNLGTYYTEWQSIKNKFAFSPTKLGNINRLSFELYDSHGQQILFQGSDSTVTDKSHFTHQFNKYTQMSIMLTMGVVENELNTKTNF